MDLRKALELAQASGLDLAEVSPTASPPVCKILDFGKYKYQQKKKIKASKKNQVVIILKEIQFRPQTDQHDIDFKVRHILRFLEEGNKVKASVRFRGRESAHVELGHALIKQVVEQVGDAATIEQSPRLEGKILSLIFAPNAKSAKRPHKASAAAKASSAPPPGPATPPSPGNSQAGSGT